MPLPVLALLIGEHVKMLRPHAWPRDGRLSVTYARAGNTCRRLRARATLTICLAVHPRSYYAPAGTTGGPKRADQVGPARQRTTMFRFARCVARAG